MPAAVVLVLLVLLTNVIDVLGSPELKGASERARRGRRSDGDEDKREEKSWHRHHHRLSPLAASFLCGAAHVPPSLPPSPSLLSAAAVAVRPSWAGRRRRGEPRGASSSLPTFSLPASDRRTERGHLFPAECADCRSLCAHVKAQGWREQAADQSQNS